MANPRAIPKVTTLYDVISISDVRNLTFRSLTLPHMAYIASINRQYRTLMLTAAGEESKEYVAYRALMYYLRKADWDAAGRILNAKPHLMFQKTTFANNSEIVQPQSPLQYVIHLVDNHGLTMLQQYLTNLKFCDLYAAQIATQTTRYNFDLFYRVYASHVTDVDDETISNEDLGARFVADVGSAQYDFLPMWVLIEQCVRTPFFSYGANTKFDWTTENNFELPRQVGPITITHYLENYPDINVRYPERAGVKPGRDFAIFRGWIQTAKNLEITIEYSWLPETKACSTQNACERTLNEAQERYPENALAIYKKLIAVRTQRQPELIKEGLNKRAAILTEINELNNFIATISPQGQNKKSFLSFTDRVYGCTIKRNLDAARVKIKVLEGELKPAALLEYKNELTKGSLSKLRK